LKRKLKLFIAGLFVTGWLFFVGPSYAYATENINQEQVVISPAQQAVNTAIATATTEVQQAIAATDSATVLVATAQTELTQAQSAVTQVNQSISTAQIAVNAVDTATTTINNIDLTINPTDQSSQVVQDAKQTITTAQTAIDSITVTTAQTEILQVSTAKTEASTAQATAQTELTQANIAIDNAQTAVNNLQATIGTTTNVLAGVDDAGIRMNLPFNLQMGGTLYNNVYVGSNATITFGVDEGWVYYQTPNAPSVSIAGWDWTTWSTGTGITYSTTGSSLDIAWDLRPYPQQDASTQMVQIRFNADVNPNDGAWMANVTATGPIPNGARFNYRETTNGTIIPIEDTNTGSGFAGQISQGTTFTPYVDPNTSTVQAAVDAANAVITQLNQSLSPVVSQNSINTSSINSINTSSLTNAINSASNSKTNLQTSLNTKASQLTTAINNNIPTPAPILSTPVVDGTTVTVAPELPTGYTANTWFYQVITDDPNAENPYEGQTLNTDGAPESIQLAGLTEGATYTIRVANWSGPVSQYTETVISIPAIQSSNLISGGLTPVEPPVEEPPVEEPPVEEPPVEEPPVEEPPVEEPPVEEPTEEEPIEEPAEEPAEEETPLTVEEIVSVVEDLIADGNLTASDAEAVLDALMSDGEITSSEVNNLSEALSEDGVLTIAEKEIVADALIAAADGEPVAAANIEAAGLEYRDLPPQIPVEVREDANGNPVVITAEVASALLTLESPAALVGAIAGCFNPDEAIEGLTEEQQCEVFKALANIGADMSPQERQKAKEVLVAAVLVGQVILGSSILRIRG
jgi:polyhydroxyalkanoate synthesis regulator phasin